MGVNVTFGGSRSSSASSIAFFSSGLVSGFVTLLNVNGWELEQFRSHLVSGFVTLLNVNGWELEQFRSHLVSGFVTLLNVNGWELEQFRSHLVSGFVTTGCKQTKLTLKMREEMPFTDREIKIVCELKQHTEKMFEPFCHLAC